MLGLLGVAAFSLTLPATRVAVGSLHPLFVGLGRAVLAALLAGVYLAMTRSRLPRRQDWPGIVVVALGVVIGFPVLTAYAMRYVDASHGGVVLGVLPLATVAAGFALYRERPTVGFWVTAVIGCALVVLFSLWRGGGGLHLADLALLAAVIAAAVGYAVGARLTRSLGGAVVISWALVISAPFLIAPAVYYAPATLDFSFGVWFAFLYVSFVSQFLGFLPWYRALALGGIARVSQMQLLQPFLTLVAAAVFVGEVVDGATVAFALLVVAVVAIGRRCNVARPADAG